MRTNQQDSGSQAGHTQGEVVDGLWPQRIPDARVVTEEAAANRRDNSELEDS